jgi:WD40 repeat protein
MNKKTLLPLLALGSFNQSSCLDPQLAFIVDAQHVAVCPSSPRIATLDHQGNLQVLGLATGAVEVALQGSKPDTDCKIRFSPCGGFVAASSCENGVGLFDVRRQTVRELTGHTNRVDSLDFSPDGRLLATGSWDNSIKIWRAQSGECFATLNAHNNWVNGVVFSPSGRYLASLSHDGTVKIWNTATWDCVKTLEHDEKGNANLVAFSPDEGLIATGPDSGAIKVWRLPQGTLLHALHVHRAHVNQLPFSPDGRFIFTGAAFPYFQAWDTLSGQCIFSSGSHKSRFYSIAVSPCGRYVVTGSSDWTAKVWQLGEPEPLCSVTARQQADLVAFSSDGHFLVIKSRVIEVWNLGAAAVVERSAASSAGSRAPAPLRSSEENECVVCKDKPKTTALLPCGHRALCQDCAAIILANGDKCPVCRAQPTQAARIFV